MADVTTSAPPEPPSPPPPVGTHMPGPAPQAPKPSGGGAGATAGVVLIVIGALLLLGRFMPAFRWWALWPLIVIIAGLIQAFTPGKDGWSVAKMFDGFVTVAFGGVFLAITSGLVGWGVWGRIFSFWPLLVIALGLEILSKALHTSWPKILGSLAIIAALAYSVSASAADIDDVAFLGTRSGGEPYRASEPVAGVEEARLTLDAGVATVRMDAGVELIDLDGRSPFGRPVFEVSRDASSADVTVELDDGHMMMWPGDLSADFDVTLARDVLWDVRLNSGVSDLQADLSGLEIAALDLRPGVANCDVKLGDVPAGLDEARVDVRAGVSTVALRVPSDEPARVEIESGLSGNDVRGEFSRVDSGVWETPGYAAARAAGAPVWVIAVKSGIGSITIDTY